MRIAIMGTGGMGGYYGGCLAAAGHDVGFIARGGHLDAIRRAGLRVTGPRGDFHIHPANATDDPADIGLVDVVLFCVKLYDAESAAVRIRPMVGPETMVISVMNGVDGPARIADVLGRDHVLGGAAYASAKIDEPGVVSYRSDHSLLVFGELAGGVSERAIAFRDVCRSAGFDAEAVEDIEATLWNKFVLLSANAGLTTLVRKPAAVVYGDPDLKALAVEMMREAKAIADAKGIAVAGDVVERSVAMTESFPPDLYASMYHDLVAGRRIEVESFSGLIARFGRELDIPTPRHATVYACLKPYRDGDAS